MLNRFTRGAVAVAGALLTFGAVSSMMAGAAGATTNDNNFAGYQSGNGAWNFRWVTTTFTVPEYACAGDDFQAAGPELYGNNSVAVIAVHCEHHTPVVSWGTVSLHKVRYGNLLVAGDDNVTLSIYYDQTTGYDYFYATDNTAGQSASWAHKAGVAEYHYASVGADVNNPLHFPPPPGQTYVLVPFTGTTVTSYDGTHGSGLNGSWGVTEFQAVNGAHVIAAPSALSGGSSFNIDLYGNP
jgi:hypothetical protein